MSNAVRERMKALSKKTMEAVPVPKGQLQCPFDNSHRLPEADLLKHLQQFHLNDPLSALAGAMVSSVATGDGVTKKDKGKTDVGSRRQFTPSSSPKKDGDKKRKRGDRSPSFSSDSHVSVYTYSGSPSRSTTPSQSRSRSRSRSADRVDAKKARGVVTSSGLVAPPPPPWHPSHPEGQEQQQPSHNNPPPPPPSYPPPTASGAGPSTALPPHGQQQHHQDHHRQHHPRSFEQRDYTHMHHRGGGRNEYQQYDNNQRHHNRQPTTCPPGCDPKSLFVGYQGDCQVNFRNLKDCLSQYGTITNVIPVVSKRCFFVHFDEESAVQQIVAIRRMDLDGNNLFFNFGRAKPNPRQNQHQQQQQHDAPPPLPTGPCSLLVQHCANGSEKSVFCALLPAACDLVTNVGEGSFLCDFRSGHEAHRGQVQLLSKFPQVSAKIV